MRYRADIDGLRALAVLPVVFYHAGFSAFAGGFVGVDVFFVISGYLITSLIFDEIRSAQFSFRGFYVRRIRRLFPALFAVVLASCVPAYFLLLPEELEDFGQSVASLALFSSNILFWSEAGYFANAAELKPLLHTWSLAIEEQYYLFFPALLLLIKRFPGRPYLAVTAVLFCLSLLLSASTVQTAPQAAFYLLPSRTWELLLGSLIAMTAVHVAVPWLREALALAGLALVGLAVFTYSSGVAFPGLAALVPCLGTALLIVTGRREATMVGRVLSDKRLVFVGLLSYSLYLWHWPILVFAKHFYVAPLTTEITWVLVAASFAASYLSWRFVERPFRGPDAWLTPIGLFRGTAVMVVLLISVGLVFDASEGLPQRVPTQVAQILEVADDKPANRRRCEGVAPEAISLQRLCTIGDESAAPTLLVWGDSHANMLVPAIGQAASRAGLSGVFAVANGCVPVLGVRRTIQDTDLDCRRFNDAVLELVATQPQLDTVVLVARWGLHAQGTPFGEHTGATYFLSDADGAAHNEAENSSIFTAAFIDTVSRLNELERRVIVVGPVPEAGQDVPNVMAKAAWRGSAVSAAVPADAFAARQAAFSAALEAARAQWPLSYVALHQQLCDETHCVLAEQGAPLYFDDNHLASGGIEKVAEAFAGLFEKSG